MGVVGYRYQGDSSSCENTVRDFSSAMVLRPFIFQWQQTQMVVAGGFKRSVSKGGGGVRVGGTRLYICVCERTEMLHVILFLCRTCCHTNTHCVFNAEVHHQITCAT